ncbi:MAG: hypothetical protein KatS3mg077_1205 [Candidatus Binatia bacterium]|nr:MAG: hypothetical protein KatS3mg077_1205 [Candidatus Binatia bacterium]
MARVPLREVQRLFSKLIRAPEGVGPALPELSQRERELWRNLVRPHGALDAVERLDIYANMYFYRIRDALADDFPAVRATVGPQRFHNLITDYLLVHPSRSFTLRDVGAALPEFLREHPLSRDWPWLGNLAVLEWAVVEAFDAEDRATADVAALAATPPADWGLHALDWHPSLRVLRCDYPVHTVWRQCQEDKEPSPVEPEETWLRVWRRQEKVMVAAITAVEARALLSQDSLGKIAEELGSELGEQEAAQQLATWLGSWLEAEILCGWRPVKNRE